MVEENSELNDEQGSAVPGFDPEFGARLKWVISEIGSQKQAGSIAGVKPEMVGKYVAGRAKPSFYAIKELALAAEVTLDWLATGDPVSLHDNEIQLLIDEAEVDFLRKAEKEAKSLEELKAVKDRIENLQKYLATSYEYINTLRGLITSHGKNAEKRLRSISMPRDNDKSDIVNVGASPTDALLTTYRSAEELGDEFILLPRYEVRAAAGAGAVVHSEQIVDHLAFKAEWIHRTLRRVPAHLILIEAQGDSMEPTISDGDLLLIDTSENKIRDYAIYVLSFNGDLLVKRVQRKLNGDVVIVSDNDHYPKDHVEANLADQLRIVGQVVWHGGVV